MKCDSCHSEKAIKFTEDFDTRDKDFKGVNIIVSNVEQFKCGNCAEEWISARELERVNSEIGKKKNLNGDLFLSENNNL